MKRADFAYHETLTEALENNKAPSHMADWSFE